MGLTQKYGLIFPANKKANFDELEAKMYPKIKAHFGGNMKRWVDINNPIQNTATGEYWYVFPVQFTAARMKTFAEKLGLSQTKLAYLKNNIKKLDTQDKTWFPDD